MRQDLLQRNCKPALLLIEDISNFPLAAANPGKYISASLVKGCLDIDPLSGPTVYFGSNSDAQSQTQLRTSGAKASCTPRKPGGEVTYSLNLPRARRALGPERQDAPEARSTDWPKLMLAPKAPQCKLKL